MTDHPGDFTVGIEEAADMLGVSASTIRRWVDQRRLVSIRTLGGHRRFRRSDLEALRALQVEQ